jgi:hypothetical protein
MEKADGRALETQLNRLPHTQKTVYQPTIFSLLNLRRFPPADSWSDITCCGHCTSPQIKKLGQINKSSIYQCKMLSLARHLICLQASLYVFLAKKINSSIISNVCLTAYLWEKQHREWILKWLPHSDGDIAFKNAPTEVQTKTVSGIVEADKPSFWGHLRINIPLGTKNSETEE